MIWFAALVFGIAGAVAFMDALYIIALWPLLKQDALALSRSLLGRTR